MKWIGYDTYHGRCYFSFAVHFASPKSFFGKNLDRQANGLLVGIKVPLLSVVVGMRQSSVQLRRYRYRYAKLMQNFQTWKAEEEQRGTDEIFGCLSKWPTTVAVFHPFAILLVRKAAHDMPFVSVLGQSRRPYTLPHVTTTSTTVTNTGMICVSSRTDGYDSNI